MTITTQTYEGVPDGSCLAQPPHLIADTQARYLQDILLDELGLGRRRGLVAPAFGVVTFADPAVGVAQAMNPAGIHKVGVLRTTGAFGVTSDDYSTKTDCGGTWPTALSTAPYSLFDSKPANGGGSLIGTATQTSSGQALAYWRGGEKADYTTGTVTATRGSTAVTGSGTTWAANVGPGMFLFATADDPAGVSTFIGVVKQVTSDTALTLESAALFSATAKPYKTTALRGLGIKYSGGKLTTQVNSLTVVGSSTKFIANQLGGGAWYLFRSADNAYIGKVASVQNDTTLTLTANAAVALTVEGYFAIKADASYAIANPQFGFLNAVYSQRQFFAKGINLWFTEADDFEATDTDQVAGNFVEVASTKVGAASMDITAIAPAYNSLLITKENETFTLVGSTPTSFELRKLLDDGALSPMSVQQYQGGVVYAGKLGIYYYDGVESTNIVQDRLGDFYKGLVRSFDPTRYRMWSTLTRDHYKLFIESVTPGYSLRKGSTLTTPTRMTISIYLPNRAVTFHTNMDIRGSIELPAQTGRGVWYLVNTATGARLCSTTDLFESNGAADTAVCSGNTAGPDFYLESKRYSLGDDLRKKLFKQLALHYFCGGDNLKLDTVTGLNESGVTSLSEWIKTILSWDQLPPIATTWDSLASQYPTWDSLGLPVFFVKRIKFLKRDQHLGFRIYQKSNQVSQVKLGPWSIGFKLQRPGRI